MFFVLIVAAFTELKIKTFFVASIFIWRNKYESKCFTHTAKILVNTCLINPFYMLDLALENSRATQMDLDWFYDIFDLDLKNTTAASLDLDGYY